MELWQDCCEAADACQEVFFGPEEAIYLQDQGIILCGTSLAREHFLVRRTRPNFHVLLYSIKGQGKMLTPNAEMVIEADTLTLLPAGSVNGFQLDSDEWQVAWLILENNEQWQGLANGEPKVSYCEHAQGIFHAMNMYFSEAKLSGDQSGLAVNCLDMLMQLTHKSLFKQGQQSGIEIKLRHLFNQVEQQLHRPWSVAELAEQLHYSEPHFFRLCLQYLGMSPKQYLLQLKMARAKHLLVTQRWAVGQVALALGYSDVANFSNRFKKHFGESPSQMRLSRQV
ncbi:AraC family transcriptional regulator [Motilimonas eburnea]|uniref:AraC family transcriptional regulator n=1 Tax=Motilimonas eburnea TaxID=1737488 RepID=UPI001E433537|nr:AraC family transcriptional regulator [Motilimonas eburnea]MCE2569926.1 AraC family transcriptional regulator [Motilimonas eburnea]